jgi:hypothetical protein
MWVTEITVSPLDVLNYWRQQGIGGHTIPAYMALEPSTMFISWTPCGSSVWLLHRSGFAEERHDFVPVRIFIPEPMAAKKALPT